jgi:hypothetical protein
VQAVAGAEVFASSSNQPVKEHIDLPVKSVGLLTHQRGVAAILVRNGTRTA